MADAKPTDGARSRRDSAAAGTLSWLRWALAASVLAPALLFAAAAWYDRERLLEKAADDVWKTSAALREHAAKVVETQERLIRQVDRRIRGMAWDEIEASEDIRRELARIEAEHPQARVIAVTDAQGWIRASSQPPSAPRRNVAHQEYWAAQAERDAGTHISRPYVGGSTGKVHFAISRRRVAESGAFDGTVHVAVSIEHLTAFWTEAALHVPGATVLLVREDGEVLARHPDSVTPRLPQTSAMLQRFKRPFNTAIRAVSPIDGVERFVAFRRVGALPVAVVHTVPVSSVLAAWQGRLLPLGGIAALAAGGLVFAVLSVMRQVRRLGEANARRAFVEEAAEEGQRLELLGQLAAGLAHDFGNVVQSVRGGALLIERGADDPDRVRSLARMVAEAAGQGEALTRRMLDVARRDPVGDGTGAAALADPGAAVAGVCQLLSRTLGAGYRVRCEVEEGTPLLIRGDRAGLEAAVMNLVVNARDAMPGGGEVLVRVAPENVSSGPPRHPAGLAPGFHARVSVADSGAGMAPEVLARAGELFFTTKPRGKGTGLGLAGARGFAERAGGALRIESAPGRGTTVTLWLPVAAGEARQFGEALPAGGNVTPLRPTSAATVVTTGV